MRVVNGTTARRGATSSRRSSRARAFFGRDQESNTRSSGGQDAKKSSDKQVTGNGWFSSAPQVRVRLANDRAKAQLGELALLNESLMGQEPWKIRQKVEYLKSKRQAWEGVYNAACKQEISMTVANLESAMAEVRFHAHLELYKFPYSSKKFPAWTSQYCVLGCHRVP